MESNESIEILKNIHTRLGWGDPLAIPYLD